jgi:hypothetical protein
MSKMLSGRSFDEIHWVDAPIVMICIWRVSLAMGDIWSASVLRTLRTVSVRILFNVCCEMTLMNKRLCAPLVTAPWCFRYQTWHINVQGNRLSALLKCS